METIEEVLRGYRNSEHSYSLMLWQENVVFGCRSCFKTGSSQLHFLIEN